MKASYIHTFTEKVKFPQTALFGDAVVSLTGASARFRFKIFLIKFTPGQKTKPSCQ